MHAAQIAQVRRLNRLITQRVGALDDSYLQRGRPLAEARLLFETGPLGADLRGLRGRLGLDSGYFSRLLRSLEKQGLITVRPDPDDARRRLVSLTRAGRTEFAAYDRLSDQLADAMLAPLDPNRRARLVAAMAEVEHLLRAAAIRVAPEPADSVDGQWCLEQYYAELAERFEGGFDPAVIEAISLDEMTPPKGWFVIARLDGAAVGCGALKRVDPHLGEIKRVWTARDARGIGVARQVMHTLETLARDAGLRTVRLDTNRSLKEAQAMYPNLGYREVAAFNDEPYAHHWFQKEL